MPGISSQTAQTSSTEVPQPQPDAAPVSPAPAITAQPQAAVPPTEDRPVVSGGPYVSSQAENPAQAAAVGAVETGSAQNLSGIKGWLLVFVIFQSIFAWTHLNTVLAALNGQSVFSSLKEVYPALYEKLLPYDKLVVVLSAAVLGLIVWSLTMIFMRKATAKTITLVSLGVQFAASLLITLLVFILFLSVQNSSSAAYEGTGFRVTFDITSLIWIFYILKSKRVAETLQR